MPIVAFEGELVGEKNAVGKFPVNLLGELRQLFNRSVPNKRYALAARPRSDDSSENRLKPRLLATQIASKLVRLHHSQGWQPP